MHSVRSTKLACMMFDEERSRKANVTDEKCYGTVVNSFLSGSFLIKFSSLSAPTKIEELTAGSDERNTAQPSRKSNRKTLGSILGGAALRFFVWSGCYAQFFYRCRSWKSKEFDWLRYGILGEHSSPRTSSTVVRVQVVCVCEVRTFAGMSGLVIKLDRACACQWKTI